MANPFRSAANSIAGLLGYVPKREHWEPLQGAQAGRLTADWSVADLAIDEKIRRDLKRLRTRARDLAQNNVYNRRFNKLLQTNVVGPRGIRLEMDLRDRRDPAEPDRVGNATVEAAWAKWSKLGRPTVDGQLNLIDVQKLIVTTAATDGEIILRKRANVDNGFAAALQVIDADHLDHQLNRNLPDGNQIRLGIEYDRDQRPVRYWFKRWRDGDVLPTGFQGNQWQSVPADEIIHFYERLTNRQSRGIPWVNAALIQLRHMDAYREAAIVAARTGASKAGFIETPTGGDADLPAGQKDARGNVVDEINTGELHYLDAGQTFAQYDPGYPTGDFGPFNKAMLQGIAAGWDVTYNSLTYDLADVNFTSLRFGTQQERDAWRMLQFATADHTLDPVFEWWVPQAILTGELPFSIGEVDRILAAARWKGRGWPTIEPLKDAKAREQNLAMATTTRRKIALEEGEDWEENMEQLAREQRKADELGLTLGAPGSQEMTEVEEAEGEGGPPRGHINGKGNGHAQT